MTMQNRIIKLCEDAGFKRHGAGKRLSKITGVSVKTGNKWINGVTVPTLASIVSLSSFFGVRTEWLLTGDGEPYIGKDKPVNVHALLSDEVAKTGDCSKIVIHHLREISLAALNGDLVQYDVAVLARLAERVRRKQQLKDAA